jgi:hypothetical protein
MFTKKTFCASIKGANGAKSKESWMEMDIFYCRKVQKGCRNFEQFCRKSAERPQIGRSQGAERYLSATKVAKSANFVPPPFFTTSELGQMGIGLGPWGVYTSHGSIHLVDWTQTRGKKNGAERYLSAR